MVSTVLNEVVHAAFAPCEEVFRIAHEQQAENELIQWVHLHLMPYGSLQEF